MKNQGFQKLFIDQLEDIYSAEQQIVDALPKMIKLVNLKELKEALSTHLKETEHQVQRIEKIFSILGIKPSKKTCEAMAGLIAEANEITHDKRKSPLCDAAIICAAQKIEHYEIASYGALRSFAKVLKFDDKVIDLLQATLDEEGAADKKLTKIADGSFFASGVNVEAAEYVGTK